MKNYQEVVKNRFNAEEDAANSIYAPHHPIGKYTRKVLFDKLNAFLLFYYKIPYKYASLKLLDLGCRAGGMIHFFQSVGFASNHLTGIDFSKTRIEKAQMQNPAVTFLVDDVLTFNLFPKKFNLICSFDLFSHLTTKEQLVQGLQNTEQHLEKDGIFLWYDIYSNDHFSPAEDSDSWGFNNQQMIQLAEEAGLEVIYYTPLFKNFFNRYHSIYQVKRLSARLISLLEKILPGTPGNLLYVFQKKSVTLKP
jgi:SAM-dependent methyltransferase